MSIKHLEYLKVKDSKLLVVEVRPVRCLLDTALGPTYTDKWMEHSHWKELHHHLAEVLEEYEEQRAALKVECHKPKCKTGRTLQIGYMFRALPQCWCSLYFLTPRNNQTWADDGCDDGDLQDKGGRHEDLMACGEMLVVSVTLRDLCGSSSQSGFSQSSSSSHQQTRVTNELMKALGCKVVVLTISDYFKTPEDNDSCVSVSDTSSKRVSSSGPREGQSSSGVKTSGRPQMVNESGTVGEVVGSSWCHTDANALTPHCLTENYHNPEGERMNKKNYQHQPKVNVKVLQLPKKNVKSFKNLKQTSLLNFTRKSCRDLSHSRSEVRNVCSPEVNVHGNFNRNSKTSDADCVQKTKEDFKNSSHKNLLPMLDVADKSKSDVQLKVIVDDSDLEGHDEFTSYEDIDSRHFFLESPVVLRSGAQEKNVECEAQNVHGLGCSQVFESGKDNRQQNALYSASVPQRREADDVVGYVFPQTDPLGSLAIPVISGKIEENTAGNATEQYMFVDPLSNALVISRGSSENISDTLSCNSDMLPDLMLQENISEFTDVEINVTDESFQKSDEYEQQNNIKKDRKNFSSGFRYTARNNQDCSEGTGVLYLHGMNEQELAQSELNYSLENKDDVQNGIQQNKDRVMYSGEEELDGNDDSGDDWHIFDTVKKMYPTHQANTKTKIPEISSQKRLMSPLNTHDKSLHIKTEEDDTENLFISPSSADICFNKSGEEPSQVSNYDESGIGEKRPVETHPSKVIVKYSKTCQKTTLFQEHSNLELSVPGSQNSCLLGKKHSKEKVKLKNHRNVNLETNPELKHLSTSIKYPSQIEESLQSARDTAEEENERIHPTEIFPLQAEKESEQKLKSKRATSHKAKYNPSNLEFQSGTKKSCSAEDSVIARREEAHCTQVFENENSFLFDERIEHTTGRQVASDVSSHKNHLDAEDTFAAWYESQSDGSLPEQSFDGSLLENSSAESSFVNVESLNTSECLSPKREPLEGSVSHVAEKDPLLLDHLKSPVKMSVASVLRSMKFINSTHKGAPGGLTSESKCKENNSGKWFPSATPQSLETHTSILASLFSREKNSEAEKRNPDFRRDKESFTDSSAAHCNALYFRSDLDTEERLQQENDGRESWTGCSTPQHHQTHIEEQKDDLKATSVCDREKDTSNIGKKNKKGRKRVHKVNSCSFSLCDRGNHGAQAKEKMALFPQDDDGCEPGLDASDEEYVPEKVLPKGMKKVSREISSHAPTSNSHLVKANKQLLLTNKPKVLAKDSVKSDHSVDQMEENSAESSKHYTNSCVPPKASGASAEDLEFNSLESEEARYLRRSSRIKRKVPLFSECFSDSIDSIDSTSESECCNEDDNSPPHPKKLKGTTHKCASKGKERKDTLKQKGIEKHFKARKSVKNKSETVQCKSPFKESNRKIDENKDQDDASKSHLPIKNKQAEQHTHEIQEEISEPSTSKHSKASCIKQKQIRQTHGRKKNLTYYNELWNFSLGNEGGKKDKKMDDSIKKRGKKSSSTKCQATTSGNHTKGKQKRKRKDLKEGNSKSDSENCSQNAIDDEFYWKIVAEVDQLNAIASKDEDDWPLVDKRSNSSKTRNGRRPCEEECQITSEVESSERSLESLRNSYKQLQNMTNSDLEQRMEDSIPYLEGVIQGSVPNQRHKWFKQCSPELMMQQDYLIYGPFTADQSLYVLELLKKKLGHMDSLIGNTFDVPVYRFRVLVPTFFTKIVMDNENVTLNEAYKLMVKFSLNKDIAEDLQESDSRKF